MTTIGSMLQRNNGTGLSDSTHTSSSSASRYSLDEASTSPILLYKYRSGEGLQFSSEQALCALLDKNDGLRVTRKHIPRATSYLDVKRKDLYLDDEKQQFAKMYNYDSSVASIKIPAMPYWSRILLGTYSDLYIISPERSPNSSTSGDSRRSSPTSTWEREVDMKLQALAGAEEYDRQT